MLARSVYGIFCRTSFLLPIITPHADVWFPSIHSDIRLGITHHFFFCLEWFSFFLILSPMIIWNVFLLLNQCVSDFGAIFFISYNISPIIKSLRSLVRMIDIPKLFWIFCFWWTYILPSRSLLLSLFSHFLRLLSKEVL